jgi:hypothetical protein
MPPRKRFFATPAAAQAAAYAVVQDVVGRIDAAETRGGVGTRSSTARSKSTTTATPIQRKYDPPSPAKQRIRKRQKEVEPEVVDMTPEIIALRQRLAEQEAKAQALERRFIVEKSMNTEAGLDLDIDDAVDYPIGCQYKIYRNNRLEGPEEIDEKQQRD